MLETFGAFYRTIEVLGVEIAQDGCNTEGATDDISDADRQKIAQQVLLPANVRAQQHPLYKRKEA